MYEIDYDKVCKIIEVLIGKEVQFDFVDKTANKHLKNFIRKLRNSSRKNCEQDCAVIYLFFFCCKYVSYTWSEDAWSVKSAIPLCLREHLIRNLCIFQ